MKKILILTLSLIVALSCTLFFAACADRTGDGDVNPTASSSASTNTPDIPTDKQKAIDAVMTAGVNLLSGTVADTSMKLYTKGASGEEDVTELLFEGRIDLNKIEDLTKPELIEASLNGSVRANDEAAAENAKEIAVTYINSKLYLQLGDSKISLESAGLQSVIDAIGTFLPQPVAAGVSAMSALSNLIAPTAEIDDIIKDATYREDTDGTVTAALTVNLSSLSSSLDMDITAEFVMKNNAFVSAKISDLNLAGKSLNVSVNFTDAEPAVKTPEGEFGDVTPIFNALANTVQKDYFALKANLDFTFNLFAPMTDYNTYDAKIQLKDGGDVLMKLIADSRNGNAEGESQGKSTSYLDGEYLYYDYMANGTDSTEKGRVLSKDVLNAPSVLLTKISPSVSIQLIGGIVGGLLLENNLSMTGSGDLSSLMTGKADLLNLFDGISAEKTENGTKLTLNLDLGALVNIDFGGMILRGSKVTITLTTKVASDKVEYLESVSVSNLKISNVPEDPAESATDMLSVNFDITLDTEAKLEPGQSVLDGLNREEYTVDLSANALEDAKTVNAMIAALPPLDQLTVNDFNTVSNAVNAFNGAEELTRAYLDKQTLKEYIAKMSELWTAEVKTNIIDAVAALFPAYDGTDETLPTAAQLTTEEARQAMEKMKTFYAGIPFDYVTIDNAVWPEEVKNFYEKLAAAYDAAQASAGNLAA